MPKYEKHPFDKGKYQCTVSDYGHGKGNGKSRQAVSKHHDKFLKAQEAALEAAQEPLDYEWDDLPSDTIGRESDVKIQSDTEPYGFSDGEWEGGQDGPTFTEPDWMNIDVEDDSGEPEVQSIPDPVKSTLRGLQNAVGQAGPRGQSELKAFFAHQAKMARFFLSGVVDPLVSWWGKGVTADESYSIQRSEDEWKMTEQITAQWMEYRGVAVPLNPDILMVGCLGALYIPPIMNIQKNRDPNRPRRGPLALLRKWRQRRAIRRALSENPLNDEEATNIVFEP